MSAAPPVLASIPRLPIPGWKTFSGKYQASVPSLLDMAGLRFTTSGRASILLAMEMLGVLNADEVLVPTYHCPTMIAPLVALGAKPVFYPIDSHGSPIIAWLRHVDTSKIRVMLAAHYFGLAQPMAALRAWCDSRGIALIEDCAHALFGVSGDRPVGRWGDIAIGSLTKFLPIPEGGCLAVNVPGAQFPALHRASPLTQIKAAGDIIDIGASSDGFAGLNTLLRGIVSAKRAVRQSALTQKLHWQIADHATDEMDGFAIDRNLSRRALTVASRWIVDHATRDRIVVTRRKHFDTLARALAGHAGVRPLLATVPPDCVPYVFPLWVARPDPGYAELRRLRIPVARWDRLWPGVPEIAQDTGREWSQHILQLSCHQDLNESDLGRIAGQVLRLYA